MGGKARPPEWDGSGWDPVWPSLSGCTPGSGEGSGQRSHQRERSPGDPATGGIVIGPRGSATLAGIPSPDQQREVGSENVTCATDFRKPKKERFHQRLQVHLNEQITHYFGRTSIRLSSMIIKLNTEQVFDRV